MYQYSTHKKVRIGEFGKEFVYIVFNGDNLEMALENACVCSTEKEAQKISAGLNAAYNAGKNDQISATNQMILENS